MPSFQRHRAAIRFAGIVEPFGLIMRKMRLVMLRLMLKNINLR